MAGENCLVSDIMTSTSLSAESHECAGGLRSDLSWAERHSDFDAKGREATGMSSLRLRSRGGQVTIELQDSGGHVEWTVYDESPTQRLGHPLCRDKEKISTSKSGNIASLLTASSHHPHGGGLAWAFQMARGGGDIHCRRKQT